MDAAWDMRAFVRVVEHQSFSAAAEVLGLTPSAVSKLVSRLEERLGVRLLHRTTRRLALTSEGEVYFARARHILSDIDEIVWVDSNGDSSAIGIEGGRDNVLEYARNQHRRLIDFVDNDRERTGVVEGWSAIVTHADSDHVRARPLCFSWRP